MKILMTADGIGGVWTYATELSRGLTQRGVQVTMAVMGRSLSEDQRNEIHHIPNCTALESEFKLEWMEEPWEDVEKAGAWLLQIQSQVQPDIVHFNGYVHAALPWRAPTLVVAHSCVCSWWLAVRGTLPPYERYGEYRERVRAGLAAADFVTAPTRSMLDSLRHVYGFSSSAAVIYNARDFVPFRPAPRKEPFIFSAGRLWDEAKNIAQLDRACKQLAWPIVLAGEMKDPSGRAVCTTNIQSRMGRLTQPELAGVLGRAGIFCLPAKYEPFGLTALEAALSGCALVLGDIPSLRELWDGAALFVSPDHDAQLAGTLNRLARHTELRERLASAALKRGREYSIDRQVHAYLQVYSRLRGRRNAPVPEGVRACAS